MIHVYTQPNDLDWFGLLLRHDFKLSITLIPTMMGDSEGCSGYCVAVVADIVHHGSANLPNLEVYLHTGGIWWYGLVVALLERIC